MKKTNKLLTLLTMGALSAGIASASTVVWTGLGGDGNWATSGNWTGGTGVPVIDGTDDAQISTGGAATYTPGGDLIFQNGSNLILDGGSLTQTGSADWFQFKLGSTFTITAGGLLDVSIANNLLVAGNATGPGALIMNNGTLLMKKGTFDDERLVDVSNGSTITVTEALTLQAASTLDLTDSTLNMRNLTLNAYANRSTFLNINDGAQVNLLNTATAGTGVITKQGGSMVNFAAGSTGSMFIDNLSVADLETMIGEGKFGIGGTGSTTLADYTYGTSGTGVTMAIPEPATLSMVVAFGGAVLFIRRKLAM